MQKPSVVNFDNTSEEIGGYMSSSIARFVSLFTLAIICACFMTIGSFWLYDEYSRTTQEIAKIRDYYLDNHKNEVKQSVLLILRHIQYKRDFLLNKAKDDIRQRVYEAHSIAHGIFDKHKGTKSMAEIKELVKEALRHQRFNNGRGYYFATNLNGIEELFADRPELEGKDLLHSSNPRISKVIRDMIELVKTRGEGYYEYLWSKPGKKGLEHEKISYIKYFAPFDWFIGTGEYLDDIELDIQREILVWISGVKAAPDDYIFVFDRNGVCLSHFDSSLIGKNIMDIKDSAGKYITKDIIEASRRHGGDFVSYGFKSPTEQHERPKISYVTYYERWGWVIGSGIYTDGIEKVIRVKEQEDKQRLSLRLGIVVGIISVFALIVIILSRLFFKRFYRDIGVFTDFFRNNPEMNKTLTTEGLYFKEFKGLASALNTMIEKKALIESALDKTRQNYKDLFDHMVDGFSVHEVIVDEQGRPKDYRFLAVNPAFERLTGLNASDIVGKTVLEVLPETESYWIEGFGNVALTGEPLHFENFSRALGRYYEVTAYSPRPNHFACTFVDITERVNMYKALEDLTRNLEEKVREEVEQRRRQEVILLQQSKLAAMGDMLISISHHWRQPLTVIGLIVQSLEDYYDSGELDQERIKWIVGNVMERLRSLSDTIDSFSRYVSRSQTSDFINVYEALQDTVSVIVEDLNSNDISIEVIHKGDGQGHVLGNVHFFHQVLLALLTNAKEAILQRRKDSGPMPDRGFIKVSYWKADKEVGIRIEDNGGGIPEDIMDRIFEPYFTTKEKSYTTGLGLYLSKIIIEEQMEGRIYAENIDVGAAFTIILPAYEMT